MIMPADGPSPEGDELSEVLAAANRHLAKAMNAYNAASDPEMGDLSPEQMFRLLYSPWCEQNSPIQLNIDIPTEQFDASPFFRRISLLLRAIHDRGGVKATSKKNLPRRFVDEMMRQMLDEETCAEIRKYKKTINEQDVYEIHIPRVVAKCAGLIRFVKGKLVVPKKKVPLLAAERSGELFQATFVAFFRKFNLGYLYPIGPDLSSLQSCVAYTLYRLDVVAADWVAIEDLAQKVLLPAVRQEMEAELGSSPYVTPSRMLKNRILGPLIAWGLLEGRHQPIEGGHFQELVAVRNTPLQRAVMRFELGG